MYDRMTQRSRGFAFVTMRSTQDAMAAIEKLDGSVCSTLPSIPI
jgi:RNA recognition motif-containing protein